MKTNAIALNFTEEERKKIRIAAEQKALSENDLLRLIIREKLNEVGKSESLDLKFDLSKDMKEEKIIKKLVRINDLDYERIQKVCRSLNMTPSSFVRNFIYPKIEEIIEEGR